MNKIAKRHDSFYVYMVEDRNGTYYSGYTQDLNNRLGLHSKGHGAKFLIGRAPLKLVFYKEYRYYKNALVAEQRLKRLTRKHKQQLVHIFESSRSAQRELAAPADLAILSPNQSAGAPEFRFGGKFFL